MNIQYSFLYILLITCTIAMTTSCEKEIVDEFTPIEEKWTSLDDFISSANSTKTVSISNAEDDFVVSTDNAIIHFKAYTIKDAQTGEFVEGPIEMNYTEILNYKDLLLNNLNSYSYGEAIYCDYMINYQLKQGSKTLTIDEFNPALIYLKKENEPLDDKIVYSWNDNGTTAEWISNINNDAFEFDWDFNVDGENYVGSGYKMLLRGAGIFCLAELEHLLYPDSEDYALVEASISDEFKIAGTKVFVARKEDFSLIPMNLLNGKYLNSMIRKGEEVTIFGMTVLDEKLYFGKKNIIVGETNNYTLSFNEVSYVEAINELQKM